MQKIAIIGQQCSGKSTAAKIIDDHYENALVKFADPIYTALHGLGKQKHRAFMQAFGDLAKVYFGEMVFVEAFEKTVKSIERCCHDEINLDHGFIVCDDVRRSYEAKKCKELGFKIIYIDTPVEVRRARADALGLAFIENHNSETEVPELRRYADIVLDGSVCLGTFQNAILNLCRLWKHSA